MSSVKPVIFLNELRLAVLMDNSFRLVTPFYVMLGGQEIIIPADFKTDLASVPRLPVIYWLLGGRGHKAAVIHDWLYQTKRFPRDECDAYFYHALVESGVWSWYAKAMWRGVRAGGAAYYNANRESVSEV
jgi:hypothetical protein